LRACPNLASCGVSTHPEETSYDAGNRCPDAALDAAPQAGIRTREFYSHEIAAFTEREPADEEALLCKALSAYLANRADLFRDRSEEVNGRERGAKA
jgi:hypothetical protein